MKTAITVVLGLVATVGCAPVEVVRMREEATTGALGGTIGQCAADTAYFDGACRDLEWFEAAFAGAAPRGTEFVGVVGGSARRGSGLVVAYTNPEGGLIAYAVRSGTRLGTRFAGYEAVSRTTIRYAADSEPPVEAEADAIPYFWMETTTDSPGRRGAWTTTAYEATGRATSAAAPSSAGYILDCDGGATSSADCSWAYWIASGTACSSENIAAACAEQAADAVSLVAVSCGVLGGLVGFAAAVLTGGGAVVLTTVASYTAGGAAAFWGACTQFADATINEAELAAGCQESRRAACDAERTDPGTYDLYVSLEAAASLTAEDSGTAAEIDCTAVSSVEFEYESGGECCSGTCDVECDVHCECEVGDCVIACYAGTC